MRSNVSLDTLTSLSLFLSISLYNSSGKYAKDVTFVLAAIMLLVSTYNDFTAANDIYAEHDMGKFDYNGKQIMWKIDYYDKDYKYLSPNPADISLTNRVLSILLTSEF